MSLTATRATTPGFRFDGHLLVAFVFLLLVFAVYLLPLVPRELLGQWERLAVELPLLLFVISLAATAAHRVEDPRAARFWRLFAIANGFWLIAIVADLALGEDRHWLFELIKDLALLLMYTVIAIAIDLQPGNLQSSLMQWRSRLAAISSGLLIVGLFGYFALVPALAGPGGYQSSFAIYAILDCYLALRFLFMGLASPEPGWRLVMLLLAATFAIYVGADIIQALLRSARIDPGLGDPGAPLNVMWYVNSIPLFLATRIPVARAEPVADQGTRTASLNLAPVLMLSAAIPLLHVGGYGFALLPEETHHVRDVFVFFWLAAASLGITWQYVFLRSRWEAADNDRLNARSEAVALQSQLRQAQRLELMGQLSGGLAHEFGNSLFGAESIAQKLLRDVRCGKAGVNETRLEKLVNALSDSRTLIDKFRRLDTDKEPVLSGINIVDEIRGTVELIRPGIESEVALRFHASASNLHAIARRSDLQQVAANLILNARDAIRGNGHIDVHVFRSGHRTDRCTTCGELVTGERIGIRVTDSGPGVPAELREQIFQPLVSTKPAGEGSGLGLAIVNTLVHQLRGHIVLGSSDDAFCTFTVLLPPAETDTATDTPTAVATRSLLIVETDGVLTDSVRRHGTLGTLFISHVASADAALVVLGEADRTPDVVLVGNLGDPVDTHSIIEQVRTMPKTRLVLCCKPRQRRAYDGHAGIDATLDQPPDPDQLASVLLPPATGETAALAKDDEMPVK